MSGSMYWRPAPQQAPPADTALNGTVIKHAPYSGLTVTLVSDGLLSKWGFCDGEEPNEVWDILDQTGQTDLLNNWHDVLVQLVEEYLLPALDQHVEVERIGTSHNPIRARTVDGVDAQAEDVLTPASVEVPMERVIELLRAGQGA